MKFMRLRPLLAMALLVFVLGTIGVTQAIAASQDKTDTSTEKANTSAVTDQNQGAPIEKTDPSAAGAKAPKASSTTLPRTKVIDAVVDSDGSLARGTGAASAQRFTEGNYEVIFDRNVRDCAYTGTIGNSGASQTEPPGEIAVVGRKNNVSGVYVTTFNSSGTASDRGFHLQVAC